MKSSCKNFMILWFSLICIVAARPTNAAFFDWLWPSSKDTTLEAKVNGPLISVPFEAQSDDDKFLEEATKFTELMKSSQLDQCQHKVVLKIKTSCSGMTEEELAKMSVNLLNCQSMVDGRQQFPCTDSMTLKQCTEKMDASMWNAYHMMNNRARAVCLAARRSQFQALSEMTVNKLMSTAHDQIVKMESLFDGQERLEQLTHQTLDEVEKGHGSLMEQQERLRVTQHGIQSFITHNLQELTREKALIAAGHQELSKMTQGIKDKLDEANQQLALQSFERSGNHKQLVADIEAVQKQAQDIFKRIDLSTERLLSQHRSAASQYEATLRNLVKINDTVNYLLTVVGETRKEIDERFHWIRVFLGGAGDQLDRLTAIVLHLAYLLLGMLLSSFLHLPLSSRAALALIVPLNLVLDLRGEGLALELSQMTVLLVFITLLNGIVSAITSYLRPKREALYLEDEAFRRLGLDKQGYERDRTDGAATVDAKPATVASRSGGRMAAVARFIRSVILNLKQTTSRLIQMSPAQQPPAHDEHLVSSSDQEDEALANNTWTHHTPLTRRDSRMSSHHLVTEWLHTKVDYASPPLSTSSKTSGSPKSNCSAICRNGRRCRNTRTPGREFCFRHVAGTSVAS